MRGGSSQVLRAVVLYWGTFRDGKEGIIHGGHPFCRLVENCTYLQLHHAVVF